MIRKNKAAFWLVLLSMIGCFAAPAFAGLLNTGTPYGGWSGSTPFVGTINPDLKGHIDWAVFGPNVGDFPFSGYTPSLGELTYAYQVFGEGLDHISTYYVPFSQPANNFASFSDAANGVTGTVPTYTDSLSAYWEFTGSAGIGQGANSEGLVYSSSNIPTTWYSIVVNGGTVALAEPVPAPSSIPIPEPATIWLLLSALGLLIVRQLRRR